VARPAQALDHRAQDDRVRRGGEIDPDTQGGESDAPC
jgi:hypothetical protein